MLDMVQNHNHRVIIKNPHEFSASLAKMMCLGDEIFENDVQVSAQVTPYAKGASDSHVSVEQYSNKNAD